MIRWNLAVGAVLLAAATSYGAEPRLPHQPPPRMAVATIDAQGSLEIAHVVFKPVWETKTKQAVYTVVRVIDGREVPEQRVHTFTYQESHDVPETRVTKIPPGAFWVHRDGELLDAAAAAEALSHSIPIVLNRGNPREQLEPFYLQFFKPGTVIVGIKPEPPTMVPPAAAPAPPAVPPAASPPGA
ncbi:MAG: hypothetical protein ABR915_14255, partial [Thermoguttaceae bacterium]